MGHSRRVTDAEAVKAVVASILAIAEESVFKGETEWLKELPSRTIAAESLDVYFRLQEDRLDWQTDGTRTMIVVRVARSGEVSGDQSWSLWVRVADPKRPRLAPESSVSSEAFRRSWRKERRKADPDRTAGPERPRDRVPPDLPWTRHEDVWIHEATNARDEKNQREDLEAQVALFFLQTASVPAHGPVRDSLVQNLRRNFNWSGFDSPDATALQLIETLRIHKWWPDDWKSWRKLVRKYINAEWKKEHRRQAPVPTLAPDEDGCLTIDQAAIVARISRSKAYEMVRDGRMPASRSPRDGRWRVPANALTPSVSQITRARLIGFLRAGGRTKDAARKWLYRRERSGMTLTEIAEGAGYGSVTSRRAALRRQ